MVHGACKPRDNGPANDTQFVLPDKFLRAVDENVQLELCHQASNRDKGLADRVINGNLTSENHGIFR
jgi:hypothetical protein